MDAGYTPTPGAQRSVRGTERLNRFKGTRGGNGSIGNPLVIVIVIVFVVVIVVVVFVVCNIIWYMLYICP